MPDDSEFEEISLKILHRLLNNSHKIEIVEKAKVAKDELWQRRYQSQQEKVAVSKRLENGAMWAAVADELALLTQRLNHLEALVQHKPESTQTGNVLETPSPSVDS